MIFQIKNNKLYFVFLFFFLLLLLGLSIYKDYGISIDEESTRLNGFITLKYIFEIIFPNQLINLNNIMIVPGMFDWQDQGLGIIFDLPTALLEYLFKIEDSENYYLFRHITNYLFFLTSLFFFFMIIVKRYQSYLMAFIGTTFLLLSPRIFADSFYNNKDIIFLSFFIINIYTAINFLEKTNYKNASIFALSSALCISSRLLGIILPSLIILILIINILREENSKSKKTKSLLFFLFLFPLLTIIFWPYLWENPIDNFLYSFKALSDHDIDIYNFYLGEYVLAKNLPWHYSLVWIFITTPFLYLVLFLIGFVFITRRFFKRLFKIEKNNSYIDLWRSNNELYDLIFYLTFLIPIFVVIDLNSTLYDGWRHLYFIYPSMLMISIYALNLIKIYFTKRKNKYLYSLILICVLPTLIWMYKYHPYQNIYFNFIAGKNFNENFEMDYWGLSNRESLEYIAERSDKKITVANISTTNLNLSKKIISKELRNKIIISNDLNNSDYIVNNYRNWNGNVKPQELIVPSNYKVYYQIKVDGVSINTIYKKK